MIYLYSFIFCGFVCLIGQLILDNTKLTPGHVTALFVIIGAFLDIFGIYDKIVLYSKKGQNELKNKYSFILELYSRLHYNVSVKNVFHEVITNLF